MLNEEFWVLVLDTVVSLVTYFATALLAPEQADMVIYVILALQPIFLALIAAFASKKVAAIKAGAFSEYMASPRK
jgi:uncharacterized YccA/Bax inhibitor family protein